MMELQKSGKTESSLAEKIEELIRFGGGDPESFDGRLVMQQLQASLKLLTDGHDTGQLKVITRALKEMRYAYHVFNKYSGCRRVSIFGSARTPEGHADYAAASRFSTMMGAEGWMCITGAAEGIMKAGLEGLHPESSFGLSIRLPFESGANAAIEGDPKHIVFRYFFTRKLMFLSHSDALAVFPGGFGTMDELFEALTLMQTGKAKIIPIVLLEGENKGYWRHWQEYIDHFFLKNGWISEEDFSFFYIARTPEEAVEHVLHFYSRYVSSRYVEDQLVIRLRTSLTDEQLEQLNSQYRVLIKSGKIERVPVFPEEEDDLEYPRIAFRHTHSKFGLVRQFIDTLNNFN